MFARTLKRRRKAVFFYCLSLSLVAATQAREAWRPAADDEILETLPQAFLQGRYQLQALQKRFAKQPNNDSLALRIATLHRGLGDQEGDPRYYGYARAALKNWWDDPDASVGILALRAKLKEKNHQYSDARADLKLLLKRDPGNTQAWIDHANIARVQGDYDAANASCDAIAKQASKQSLAICRLPQMLMTGQAEQAYAELQELIPSWQGPRAKSLLAWGLAVQAEAARAMGDDARAEQHYREGLQAVPENLYLRRGLGELLIDQQRPKEALQALKDFKNDNGALMMFVLAAKQSGEAALVKQWQPVLAQRFQELRYRGDGPHGRYEARYLLEIEPFPEMAAKVVDQNWQQQKEIADARISLMVAVRLQSRAQAEPVLSFMRQHGTQHAVLQHLVEALP